MTRDLQRLKTRLKKRRFPENDKLRILVSEAYEAVWTANQHTHSLTCQGKMGVTYFFQGDDGCGRKEP
jgi:hypothetical protein